MAGRDRSVLRNTTLPVIFLILVYIEKFGQYGKSLANKKKYINIIIMTIIITAIIITAIIVMILVR